MVVAKRFRPRRNMERNSNQGQNRNLKKTGLWFFILPNNADSSDVGEFNEASIVTTSNDETPVVTFKSQMINLEKAMEKWSHYPKLQKLLLNPPIRFPYKRSVNGFTSFSTHVITTSPKALSNIQPPHVILIVMHNLEPKNLFPPLPLQASTPKNTRWSLLNPIGKKRMTWMKPFYLQLLMFILK